jgi:hypothetical protein
MSVGAVGRAVLYCRCKVGVDFCVVYTRVCCSPVLPVATVMEATMREVMCVL